MNIVCIGYLHGSGGAEKQIILLANALAEFGHRVTVIALAECNLRYNLSQKVKLINLSELENYGKFNILKRFFLLYKCLSKIKPDITINYWFQSTYFTTLMPRKITGKIVYSERGDPGDKEYEGLLGIVRKYAFRYVDGFVFQTNGALNYFDESIKQRATVIGNPITIPDQLKSIVANRDKRIVNVGRLHPQKNHKLLLDAFEIVHKSLPDYKLEIYGEGILKEKLEKEIIEKGLDGFVKIFKPRKDILECIYNASLFVLTSDYEGMPNALMEAMALGLPCVSTDCKPGGARALITDNFNGYITPIGNKEILATKIKYILNNNYIADVIGKNAVSILNSNSYFKIFGLWNSYLEKVLKKIDKK